MVDRERLKSFNIFTKYWHLIFLIITVLLSYHLREIPNHFGILPDIDTYYIYRMGELLLSNNLELPERDMLRNYPYGDDFFDRRGALYAPVLIYLAFKPLLNLSFFQFSFIFPSIMGALSVLIMFFVCKELFNSKKAGLLGALFLGTIAAFYTRTSTGEIEKEATSAPFMFLTFLFFIKSFKENNFRKGLTYGILSGIFLGITGSIWGGVQILYLLYALFAFVLLLFNKNIKNLLVSYIPTIILGIGITEMIPSAVGALSSTAIPLVVAAILAIRFLIERFKLIDEKQIKFLPVSITVILIVSFLIGSIFIDEINNTLKQIVDRITLESAKTTTVAESIPGDLNSILFSTGIVYTSLPNLGFLNPIFSPWLYYTIGSIVLFYFIIKTKNLLLLFPMILLIASIQAVFFGIRFTYMLGIPAAMISGFFLGWIIDSGSKVRTVTGSNAFFLLGFLAIIAGFIANLNIFLIASGAIVLFLGIFIKRPGKIHDILGKTDWFLFCIFGVLSFIVAYHAIGNQVISYGYFVSGLILLSIGVLIKRSEASESIFKKIFKLISRYGTTSLFKRIHDNISSHFKSGRIDVIIIPIIIFVCLSLAVNIENGRAYANSHGPSINQQLLDAMDFLKTQTPENSSVFSWWDFGYWFQTVGNRPTILDGGGSGAISRYDAALFFTDNPTNWEKWKPTLVSNISYILMDYTLPGKYGAITKIASDGKSIIGFIQFDPKRNEYPHPQQPNVTIFEYTANTGPQSQYIILLPSRTGETTSLALTGPPQILISQNGQIVNRAYINDICTPSGVIKVANQTNSAGGCISFSSLGVFYIPQEAEHTMFSRLMFMDGADLPIEKAFDNGVIKIYSVKRDQ